MVTLKTVAETASVSIATASRALRDDPLVAEETTHLVREVAKKLSYRPLRTASRQTSKLLKAKNISLLLIGMHESMERLPSVAAAIQGARTSLTELGANLLEADLPKGTEEPSFLGLTRLDGIIAKAALRLPNLHKLRSSAVQKLRTIPTVWLMDRPKGFEDYGDLAGCDDFAVGQLAARHLHEHGHRTVAFLNSQAGHVSFERRKAGFLAVCQEWEMSCSILESGETGAAVLPLHPIEEVRSVQVLVDEVLSLPHTPTAVFTPCDSVAVFVWRALHSRNKRPGVDLSVISANNESMLIAGLFPELTTIDTRSLEVGEWAVRLLSDRLMNRFSGDPISILVKPRLCSGGSVAKF